MSEPSAHIRDHQSLIELNNTLEYSADSILKILEQVDAYLKGVIAALKNQIKLLEDELRVAEENLLQAERDLSACEASQEWDEENSEYRPSCSSEAAQVRLARDIRDKCEERVNLARNIFSECESEINEYKKVPSLTSISGAEKLLESLAKEHTDKATQKMRDILDVVERYLCYKMSIRSNGSSSFLSTSPDDIKEGTGTLTPDEKKERFNNAVQRVIERQQSDNYGSHQIADANRVIRCPQGGRPPVACICNNARDREYTRENIQIIGDDFSR